MGRLQDLAASLANADNDHPNRDRLWIGRSERGLFVDFFGCPFEEPFEELCAVISDPAVAPTIAVLLLRGPDEGGNGTCHWDLEELASASASYDSLRVLEIEQGRPGDHNTHIVGDGYEENGVLGRLLQKMPALERLVSPSAPDASFFSTEARPLRVFSVNAGYDHQSFIRNLAGARNLPALRSLEYGESPGRALEERTPFDAYVELVRSTSVCPAHVVLRNPSLSDAELRALKVARPDLRLQVVRWEADYLR